MEESRDMNITVGGEKFHAGRLMQNGETRREVKERAKCRMRATRSDQRADRKEVRLFAFGRTRLLEISRDICLHARTRRAGCSSKQPDRARCIAAGALHRDALYLVPARRAEKGTARRGEKRMERRRRRRTLPASRPRLSFFFASFLHDFRACERFDCPS